jgi:hypothetical protein
MSQIYKSSSGGGGGGVTSVTGTNGVTAAPTTGAVVVSGVNATTSTVGVASFDPVDFTVSGAGEVTLTGAGTVTAGANINITGTNTVNVDTQILQPGASGYVAPSYSFSSDPQTGLDYSFGELALVVNQFPSLIATNGGVLIQGPANTYLNGFAIGGTEISTSFTTNPGTNFLQVDTSSIPITITLDNSVSYGTLLTIKDWTGNAGTNNITIDGNGKFIDGQATVVISYNYGSIGLIFTSGNWCIITQDLVPSAEFPINIAGNVNNFFGASISNSSSGNSAYPGININGDSSNALTLSVASTGSSFSNLAGSGLLNCNASGGMAYEAGPGRTHRFYCGAASNLEVFRMDDHGAVAFQTNTGGKRINSSFNLTQVVAAGATTVTPLQFFASQMWMVMVCDSAAVATANASAFVYSDSVPAFVITTIGTAVGTALSISGGGEFLTIHNTTGASITYNVAGIRIF